jgi:methionine--tRNA ligase beta chain
VQAAQSATDASGATTQAKDTKELIYSNAIEFPLDLQVGVVRECAPVPDSDKLYILQVDMGGSTRQIVSGLQKHYTAEQLVNKRCVVVCNLKPVKFVGVQSNGMVLTAVQGETLSILSCDDSVAPGTKVAPKGSKVVIQAKFDLKKQLPLLPFAVVDQKVQFANLPLQAGNPHAAQENPVRFFVGSL